eukprot:m.27197 g.27197  ORF g.27197 m.27197 type:complete len:529 (+) comp4383_c0_seq1:283-1869(+)
MTAVMDGLTQPRVGHDTGGDNDNVTFTIEKILDDQSIDWSLPFPDMDKSCEDLCQNFKRTRRCYREAYCPYRHTVGEKEKVCKHWLRGLCKKGDQCDFLHRYDLSRMPECYFFTTYQECNNDECIFLHIDPEKKKVECPWYARGFCRHGADCKNRHTRKVLCPNYLAGFCPNGPDCKLSHPSWEIPVDIRGTDGTVTTTTRLPHNREVGGNTSTRNIEDVTCHRCRQKGHYADKCPNPPAPKMEIPNLPAAHEGPEITRVVECPDEKVGLLIGRGGSTHRMMQDATYCKIHIPRAADPGKSYREVQITGGEANVAACEAMILEKIGDTPRGPPSAASNNNAPIPQAGEVQVVIQCPNENVGMIIGRSGATFRMLQETTGAKVKIPKESAPGVPYREITLTGNQNQVEHCRMLIVDKLASRNGPGGGGGGGGPPIHHGGGGGGGHPMNPMMQPPPGHGGMGGPPPHMHGGFPPPMGMPYPPPGAGFGMGGPPMPPPHGFGGGPPMRPPPHMHPDGGMGGDSRKRQHDNM